MKNIKAILEGRNLSEEDVKAICDEVNENYKPIADWQKQKDKVESLETTLAETKESLSKLEGVDEAAWKKKVEELEARMAEKDKEYEAKIADRDFSDLIEKSISSAKGKNVKAIKALLDIESLKGSKNQQDDIEKALKSLAEAEDSKMLFGEPEPTKIGEGNPIGTVKKDGSATMTGVEKAFFDRTGVKID